MKIANTIQEKQETNIFTKLGGKFLKLQQFNRSRLICETKKKRGTYIDECTKMKSIMQH